MYKKSESWKMFNQISGTYDLLNNILSVGIHKNWKSKINSFFPIHTNLKVLDIATGTGDVIFSIMDKKNGDIQEIKGMDLSIDMMDIGKKKCEKKAYKNKVSFLEGDACKIPFDDQFFDVITISFGIRNVSNYKQALSEMKRAIKDNGKVIILESSIPSNGFVKLFYLLYFRYILPIIGGLISGKLKAYKYLNKTTEEFPSGNHFKEILEQIGFKNVLVKPLAFGISSIYVAEK
tara:strand:+ start:5532 stop:6233 length:702 start_codon:yes stop_codon:yes gene_type:complete